MKKNILAENMLRFGVKNLSESDVTRLTEADEITINDVPKHLNTLFLPTLNKMAAAEVAKMREFNKDNPDKLEKLIPTKIYFTLKKDPSTASDSAAGKYTLTGTFTGGWGNWPGKGIITGPIELPYNLVKDGPGRVYQAYFLRELRSAIDSNMLKQIDQRVGAPTIARELLGKIYKSANLAFQQGKTFETAWNAAVKAFDAAQKAKGTQAPQKP
jgi:hypothetical protein